MLHISACFTLQATFILFSSCSSHQLQHSKCACLKVWTIFLIFIFSIYLISPLSKFNKYGPPKTAEALVSLMTPHRKFKFSPYKTNHGLYNVCKIGCYLKLSEEGPYLVVVFFYFNPRLKL